MSRTSTVVIFLTVISARSAVAVVCKRLQPAYPADALPPFIGSPGPFGTVCEAHNASDLPVIPDVPIRLERSMWTVRSRYPDTFMEVVDVPSAAVHDSVHDSELVIARAQEPQDVNCGPYTVARAGPEMDEKVYGIPGGWEAWMLGCEVCGKALEGAIGPGWFCQTNGSPRFATGVWLKRKVATAPANVTIDATISGRRQVILGFGGAFTDATAYASLLLPPELADTWLRLYFGADGAGYTMGRSAPVGATRARTHHALAMHGRTHAFEPRTLTDARALTRVHVCAHALRSMHSRMHTLIDVRASTRTLHLLMVAGRVVFV
jgi:hypothetical protein